VRRLLLVRHAPTSATRAHAFPADEPLDERGKTAAGALGGAIRAAIGDGCETFCSPSARCRQTAAAAGLPNDSVVPELAECDFGDWAGRTLADVCAEDAAAAEAWMTDPASAPHAGESLDTFIARVAGWLDGQAGLDGRAVAITHGGVVKAAVVHALGVPAAAFWRIDVTPLAITELHAHDGRWTVTRVNCPSAQTPERVRAQ
jgi:broad specificity phosphatase PhoE